MKVLLTGGRGFIGSHMLKRLLDSGNEVIVVDCLTYAARPELPELATYTLEQVDIREQSSVRRVMQKYKPDHVIHMAAESHVCRSIAGPKDFITTNVLGTFNLIEEFKELWYGKEKSDSEKHRFLHFSTDEVYGEIEEGLFNEESQIKPRSPYASSKASSDLIVQSYYHTYKIDTVIVNCSNNFGENQHDEKLVPKTITNILSGKPVEIYGTGKQVRDWIYVKDCVDAALMALFHGRRGEKYCIGGEKEMTNLDMVHCVYEIINRMWPGRFALEKTHVNKRPTDDIRYAIDCSKIKKIGWKIDHKKFENNLFKTISFYADMLGMEAVAPYAEQGREAYQ